MKRPKRQLLRRRPVNLANANPDSAKLVKWAKERGYEVRGMNRIMLSVWRLTDNGKRYIDVFRSAAGAQAAIEKNINERKGK